MILMGGGRKRLCARAHITNANHEVPYIRRGSWKLSGFLMLSRAIWALFLSTLTQNGTQENIVDQTLGEGAGAPPPLSESATASDLSLTRRPISGGIQDFYLEGAQKIMYAHAHHEREARSLSGCLCSLALFWALFLCIMIQNGILKKTHSRSNFRGVRACGTPLWIRHCILYRTSSTKRKVWSVKG